MGTPSKEKVAVRKRWWILVGINIPAIIAFAVVGSRSTGMSFAWTGIVYGIMVLVIFDLIYLLVWLKKTPRKE